jgi:hypothetical protein
MLSNLKAELVRKNLVPEAAVKNAIGCTDKTARAKLNGDSDFTLTEAITIVNSYFADCNFSYEELFANIDTTS